MTMKMFEIEQLNSGTWIWLWSDGDRTLDGSFQALTAQEVKDLADKLNAYIADMNNAADPISLNNGE